MRDGTKRDFAQSSGVLLKFVLVGAGGFGASLMSMPAHAQDPLRPPTREEIQGPVADPLPISPSTQVIAGADAFEKAPCAFDAPEYASLNFVLREVRFTGAPGTDQKYLEASWSDFAGQTVPIAAICAIRDQAATLLRAGGYLAAVQVPPQTIDDGILQLDVLTARITHLEINGEAGSSETLLRRYLKPLENQPVFNVQDAERYLLLARDIPGLDARLALRPGALPGELTGEVIVSRTPVFLDAAFQNYGSPDVGREAGSVRARFTGLTGMGDVTTFSYYTSADFDSMKVLQLSHDLRVGGEGLMLGAAYTHARTNPDLSGLPIESTNEIVNLYGSYPLKLAQASSLTVSGGLDIIDQDVALSSIPLNRDRLRVLNLRLEGQWVDADSLAGRRGFGPGAPHWALRASLEARQGLGGLGASDDCGLGGLDCFQPGAVPLTRIEGQPDAGLLRGSLSAEWRPGGGISLSASGRAQITDKPLLSYEEFSAGSFNTGRGFDPGTIMGDSGGGVSLEARPADWLSLGKALAVQPFVFFDAAQVWNEDASFDGIGPQRLYSAGLGVQVAFGRTQLNLAYAAPLNRPGLYPQRPDPRFQLHLTTQFNFQGH